MDSVWYSKPKSDPNCHKITYLRCGLWSQNWQKSSLLHYQNFLVYIEVQNMNLRVNANLSLVFGVLMLTDGVNNT